MKVHFDACLRLVKLFKLTSLLEKFKNKLYTLNREVVVPANNSDEGGEEEVVFKMSQFDVNAALLASSTSSSSKKTNDQYQLTINDTDIFRN